MLFKYTGILFFLLFVLYFSNVNANPDIIIDALAEHKAWTCKNIPNPETLNDSLLIIESIDAIHSMCRENEYVRLLDYSGRKYNQEILIKFAENKKNNIIDIDDSISLCCIEQLAEVSRKLYGDSSFIEAYAYFILVDYTPFRDLRQRYVSKLCSATDKMFKKDSLSLSHRELMILTQLVNILGDEMAENPYNFRKMFHLTQQVIDLYNKTTHYSFLRFYLLKYCWLCSEKFTLFNEFYMFEIMSSRADFKLYRNNEEWSKISKLDSSENSALSAAVQALTEILHKNHPNVLVYEFENLYSQRFSRNDILSRMVEIRDIIKAYEGESPLNSLILDLKIFECEIINGKNPDESKIQTLLESARQVFSPFNDNYYHILSNLIQYQISSGSSASLVNLVSELDASSDVIFTQNKMEEIAVRLYTSALQRCNVNGYETVFSDLVQDYIEECNKFPNWETITLGKQLFQEVCLHGDIETSIILQKRILEIEQEIVGVDSPIYILEYLRYINLLSEKPFSDSDNTDIDDIINNALLLAQKIDMEHLADFLIGKILLNTEKRSESCVYLRRSQNLLEEKIKKIPQNDQISIEFNEELLSSIYSHLLNFYIFDGREIDSIDYYGKKVGELCDKIPFKGEGNWSLYASLASYYVQKGLINKAKELLYNCLAYYDKQFGKKVDKAYVEIVRNLVQYMSLYENNIDECHVLIKKFQDDFRGFENFGDYDTYIQLLLMLHSVVESKNPFDIPLLTEYNEKIINVVNSYWLASNKNDIVWYNYKLPLYYKSFNLLKYVDLWRDFALSSNANMEDFENGYNTAKLKAIESVLPELIERRKQLESLPFNIFKNYLVYYVGILNCQAMAYEFCANNQQEAESCYRKMLDFNRNDGLVELCQYLLRHHNYTEASSVAHEIDSIFHHPQSFDMTYPKANLYGKSTTLATIFNAYFYVGNLNEALRIAREFLNYFSIFIQENFDFMTENERMAFLITRGSGSKPILKLLPLMSNLSGEAYNLALRDKGIQLRATNRIQAAIAKSTDDMLHESLDSLKMLQKQLSSFTGFNSNDDRTKYVYIREKIDDLERLVYRKTALYRSKEDEVPTWQQLRDNLKNNEVAVEYIFPDSSCAALIITPNCLNPQFVHLADYKKIEPLVELLKEKTPFEIADTLYRKGNVMLYEMFWKPLEPYFQKARDIYFSPSDFLNLLSFSAFPLPDGNYLIDRYELHQLTSTARLAYRDSYKRKNNKKELTANLYGAIYYNSFQKQYYAPRLSDVRKNLQNNKSFSKNKRFITEDFPYLEWTLYEVDTLENLLNSNGVKTIKKTGDQPTEQAIRNLNGHSPDILHISTHGFFYNSLQKAMNVPFFANHTAILNNMTCTGLILANGENTWQGEIMPLDSDNILTSSEVSRLDLSGTELVILSACETALGGVNAEGVFGLQRGFKQAGVKSICASLWPVYDSSTADLMASFLSNWLNGKGRGHESMHDAFKKAILQQRSKTPSPIHWAPFVLYDADN